MGAGVNEAQPEKQASDHRTRCGDSVINELSIRTFTKGRGEQGRLAILRYSSIEKTLKQA